MPSPFTILIIISVLIIIILLRVIVWQRRIIEAKVDTRVHYRFLEGCMTWAIAMQTMTCTGQQFVPTANPLESLEYWTFSATEAQIKAWWSEYTSRLERSNPSSPNPHNSITSLGRAG